MLGRLYAKWKKIQYKYMIHKSNEKYIRYRYRKLYGKEINLENPQNFCEKIQWMKLNFHDSRMIELADKYLVRDYIKEKIGEEILIPMPCAWDKPEEIDVAQLPDKFVLKPNNSSGRVFICKDKTKLDVKQMMGEAKKWGKENLTKLTGEWIYEKIPFKIVCEEYLADDIMDYKMYFAGGEFICTQVIAGRSDGVKKFGYFDKNWNLMNIKRVGTPKLDFELPKPDKYDEMLEIATALAQGFSFIRVDLYYVSGKVYFGELSFYPNNGFIKYETEEMDSVFSDKFILPKTQK